MILTLEKPTFKNKEYDIHAPGYEGILTQYFGENKHPYYKSVGMLGHNGLDIGTPTGTPVYASHDGRVIQVSNVVKNGLGVKLVTDRKYEYRGQEYYFWTVYWHFLELKVQYDDYVLAGDLIGLADNTGISTAPHLHYALLPCYEIAPGYFEKLFPNNGYNGYIDPLPYLISMKQLIGVKSTGRQYLLGNDGIYRWIFNETLLNELHNAGVINKAKIKWVDAIDDTLIGDPWAVIK